VLFLAFRLTFGAFPQPMKAGSLGDWKKAQRTRKNALIFPKKGQNQSRNASTSARVFASDPYTQNSCATV
jgi:hypothetical protein